LLTTDERLLARRGLAPFALDAEPSIANIGIAGQVVGAHYLKIELGAFPTAATPADRCFGLTALATSHPFEQPGFKAVSALSGSALPE
jgi:hypothetical protein